MFHPRKLTTEALLLAFYSLYNLVKKLPFHHMLSFFMTGPLVTLQTSLVLLLSIWLYFTVFFFSITIFVSESLFCFFAFWNPPSYSATPLVRQSLLALQMDGTFPYFISSVIPQ